jgi:glycerol-3-phosphate dehydrogenase
MMKTNTKPEYRSGTPPFTADVDIAVIGGGVVGCAVARRMTLEGAGVVLVEKAGDILDGASKGNSAILHTGFDAPVGTLEQECVRRGHDEFMEIHRNFNLPVLKTGALVAAWSKEEEDKFETILEKGRKNGVQDLQLLNRTQVLAREPNLSPTLRSAIVVPREYVIDPWSTPLAYLKQAVENGGRALFNAEVRGGAFDHDHWLLDTGQGTVRARYVVNCAGLYGDRVDQKIFGRSEFTIKPRKGQFVVFDKAAARLLSSVILPVPTERTKGIVLFPTIFGNIVVGPTAEEQESRDDASVDEAVLRSLKQQAVTRLPGLADIPVTATYAGIRPATEAPQYRVIHRAEQHWITLGGIRSTGLTGALGLARHVHDLLSSRGADFKSMETPCIPVVPNLAEHLDRDYATPGYGEIVCHCEMVTQREISAAMEGPVPAGNLGGLKRRTRATMGRCQGFYCSARLAELTRGKFVHPLGIGEAGD